MTQFQIRPRIYEFESVGDFSKAFSLSAEDLVFTQKFLYQHYLQSQNLPCQFIFQEDFGVGEPSDRIVDDIIAYLRGVSFSRLIGIGGGSIIDISKILVVKDVTCTLDVFEDRIPFVRDKGLVLVPTTCGTGSEMTAVSVIDITVKKAKMGKRMEPCFADAAVLIPELVKGLPYEFFIYSSVDALIHAMEIYVSSKTTSYDELFCLEAIRMILNGYSDLVRNGPETRYERIGDYLKASNYAGIALSNVLCGAVHAMAMHFGSAHHVPHGESNYRFLMSVFKVYAKHSDDAKLKRLSDVICETLGCDLTVQESFQSLDNLLRQLIPDKRMRDYGMKQDEIEAYADKVIETQQRLLVNSHIPMTRELLIGIYRELY